MNRTFFQSALLASVLIFSACSKEESRAPQLEELQAKNDLQESKALVSPTDITIDYRPQQIEIVPNEGTELTATTDDQWVSIEKSEKGFLITALANDTKAKRISAIYFFQNGREVSKTLILQETRIIFPLPYFEFGKKMAEVKEWETKREELTFSNDLDMTKYKMGFTTTYNVNDHDYAKTLKYYFSDSGTYFRAELHLANHDAKSTLQTYLLQEGFEIVKAIGTITTTSKEKVEKEVFLHRGHSILAEYFANEKEPHFRFRYIPIQPGHFPTFDAVPAKNANKILEPTLKEELIAGNEFLQGDDYNDVTFPYKNPHTKSEYHKVMIKVNVGNKESYRQYDAMYMYRRGYLISSTTYFYKNFNLVGYFGKDGNFYLTEEFEAFMEREGFKADNRQDYWYSFTNGKIGAGLIKIGIKIAKPGKNFEPMLQVTVF